MGAMTAQPEITQRDLCTRFKEIMDAVQGGRSFTVTRDGHRIGELIPLRRRFVSRGEFTAMSRATPDISLDAFRGPGCHRRAGAGRPLRPLSTSRDSWTPTS
jgi:antitoxin (DNA-binding transcriptional repressor) of toxin-antitoxin stability system